MLSKFYYCIINNTNIGQYNEILLISKRVFWETETTLERQKDLQSYKGFK